MLILIITIITIVVLSCVFIWLFYIDEPVNFSDWDDMDPIKLEPWLFYRENRFDEENENT